MLSSKYLYVLCALRRHMRKRIYEGGIAEPFEPDKTFGDFIKKQFPDTEEIAWHWSGPGTGNYGHEVYYLPSHNVTVCCQGRFGMDDHAEVDLFGSKEEIGEVEAIIKREAQKIRKSQKLSILTFE